jgi:hypothetical protein
MVNKKNKDCQNAAVNQRAYMAPHGTPLHCFS